MDELSSALLKDVDLRVIVVTSTALSREARDKHHARAAAAGVLAQGLTAALLLGALQKEKSRVNVQVECDGPLRGMFMDADNEGAVRGYVKNPAADVQVASALYRYRPVLGNSGFISVMRDLGGGEYYRSSIELQAVELEKDFERYFQTSEQIETLLELRVLPTEGEALGAVGGVLVQPLPDGDREALKTLRTRFAEDKLFERALQSGAQAGAHAVLKAMFPQGELEIMARYPVAFRCRCGRDRVMNALLAMGRAELEDILQKENKAEVTCDFCSTKYHVTGPELRQLLESASN